jgi:hypothetical protein
VRDVSGLRQELDRLDATLADLPHDHESFGLALGRDSLGRVRDDLEQQIQDAARARLDVVLDGQPVLGREIRVDALSKLLESLQESVSSVAQSLTGRATSRSAIPGPLRDLTALHLAGVFEGSFGATLRGPVQGDVRDVLEGQEAPDTILDDAVETVLEIIDLAGSADAGDDPIVEAVLPLGSRSFLHLNNLSKAITDEGMGASLTWTRPTGELREARLGRFEASRLSDVLSRNRATERQLVLEGHLGTVSDIRNRVELQTRQGDIIRARVIDEIVPQLGEYYSRDVAGTFEVTTLRSLVTGQERSSYVLIGLSLLPEQPTLDDDGR